MSDGFESCTTPGCNGLPNYAAPGKGHIDGCTYPLVAPLSDAQGPGLTEDEQVQILDAMWVKRDDGPSGYPIVRWGIEFPVVESIIQSRVRAASRTALIEWADELDKPPYDLWARAAIPRLRARAATYDAGDEHE